MTKFFIKIFEKLLHFSRVKKFKFLPNLISQKGSDMRFDRGLDKKRSLFRVQKYQFNVREKFAFCNWLSHDFGQKPEILRNLFSFKKALV